MTGAEGEMKIESCAIHRNLKIILKSGETLYGKAFTHGEAGYAVYSYFGGEKRYVSAEDIAGYETVMDEELGRKVERYDSLFLQCGCDPAYRVLVLNFAVDVLSEVLAERDERLPREVRHEKTWYREGAMKEAEKEITEKRDDGGRS